MFNPSAANDAEAAATTQRVKVEDALTYLDQVKTQFSSEPDVYTHFLDIMKDFKSQQIDTPGVIRRVSQLFHGHPALIMGFNTFLPVGFKVKVEGTLITIKEPNGTIQTIDGGSLMEAASEADLQPSVAVSTDEVKDEEPEESQESGVSDAEIGQTPEDSGTEVVSDNTPQLNTAIGYVNKIKQRFTNQPSVYKRFLEILHDYQQSLQGGKLNKTITGSTILREIGELFAGEKDLLEEFKFFLPDVHGTVENNRAVSESRRRITRQSVREENQEYEMNEIENEEPATSTDEVSDEDEKESAWNLITSRKDLKQLVNLVNLDEASFFEKVRKTLDSNEFAMFIRSIHIYSRNVINASELVSMVNINLSGHPTLFNEFKQLFFDNVDFAVPVTPRSQFQPTSEKDSIHQQQVDYSSCRQLGLSYRGVPDEAAKQVCSGRTPLCDSVLNDVWVSVPSWGSEDSSSVASKKTQYEEFVYRTEDERFELDIVIEVNKYAVNTLEGARRKMARMNAAEQEKFKLDENLGGSSASLMRRAIKRIYGEHASKISDALRTNPKVTIQKVIDRMRDKEREWVEAQEKMNTIWREQNDKHMLRALDHQSTSVKTSDTKWLRSSKMVSHIEQLARDRIERGKQGIEETGPHVIIQYPADRSVFRDASELIVHHLKRQTNISVEEKRTIYRVLKRDLMHLFFERTDDISDDEDSTNGYKEERDFKVPMHTLSRYHTIYGSNSLFVFLRAHQLLCHRLAIIKAKHQKMIVDYQLEQEANRRITQNLTSEMKPDEIDAMRPLSGRGTRYNDNPYNFYDDLIADVKSLIDNQTDPNAFEDNVRSMFPQDGYLLFSIDKIVALIANQLRIIALNTDNSDTLQLYEQYKIEPAPSIMIRNEYVETREAEYAVDAEAKIGKDSNCYIIQILNERNITVSIEVILNQTSEEDEESDDKADESMNSANSANADGSSEGSSEEEEEDSMDDEEDSEDTISQSRARNSERFRPFSNSDSSPVFLERNKKLRERFANLPLRFNYVDGMSAAQKHGPRLVSGSWEGIWRKKTPSSDMRKCDLEQMNKIRRQRTPFPLSDDKESENWLATGMKRTRMHNPNFPFLSYNKYTFLETS